MEKEGLVAPNSVFTLIQSATVPHIRIDRYLVEAFPLYSRSFFKKIIEEGYVSINGTVIRKQSTPVCTGDSVTVKFPAERHIQTNEIIARNLAIDLIYQHEHFFIIQKPAGLLVHPPKTNSMMVTLMDWLVHHYKDLEEVGYIDRPGIVHRLDKDTSGLMIIPRTPIAHNLISELFKERAMHKTYLAVVQGHPAATAGTIQFPIGRHPEDRVKMYAFPEEAAHDERLIGRIRSATTHYRVIEHFKNSSLIEAKPVTGRTHQIRVHMAAIGHPIVGDPIYGGKSKHIKRHALHAAGLAFTFMETEYNFQAPLPHDMQALIEQEKTI